MSRPDDEARPPTRLPLELIGEALFVVALLVAPWIYGAVEDRVRYAMCVVLLAATSLFLWPDILQLAIPRGLRVAMAFPVFAAAQVALGQTVAPILSFEAALVGFVMALVWASIDARAGSTSTNTSRRLSLGLLLVCLSESAFAAFQWSTDRTILFGQKSEFQTMPFGSYVNHNNFAGLVSLGVPLSVAMAIGDLRRSGKLTPWGLGLIGLAGALTVTVFASGSRGGVIALVLGLMTLAWIAAGLRRRSHPDAPHRSWLVPVAVGVAILGVALVAIPSSTRARLGSVLDGSGSTSYRIDIAMASLRAFAHRPILGSGLGAFGDAVTPFKTGHGDVRSNRAEADLIEFAVEGGVVLIIGLLFFARFAWKSAHHEMLHGKSRSGKWLRAGALASCATMVFHSLFDFGFRIPANALAFAVLLGIATAGSNGTKPSTPWRCRALLAFIALLAMACVYRSIGASQERAALARTSPESRLEALDDVVKAHPYLTDARRQRGLAWMTLAHSGGSFDPARLQRAEANLQAVVRMRPQWGEARADLGWVKYYAGRIDNAKAEMAEAARLDPTHMGVGIAYAQVLAWSGESSRAVGELGRLRKLNPAWPRASALELATSWTRDAAILAKVP